MVSPPLNNKELKVMLLPLIVILASLNNKELKALGAAIELTRIPSK